MPTGVVVGVLQAVANVGATIRHVTINGLISYTSQFVPSPKAQEDPSLLAKELDAVDVRIRCIPNLKDFKTADVYQFLSAILDTDSLKRITIDLYTWDAEGPDSPSIGPALNRQRRPRLRHLCLKGVSMCVDELHHLVDSFLPSQSHPSQDGYIILERVHFLSGLFRNSLDLKGNPNLIISLL
ncbi:hypothetical protein F5Y10DRAFT_284234 [Nemania abortiva]|nr:hypothetical protein F5Y10DRAFT_284234 [Nemania abortiva]